MKFGRNLHKHQVPLWADSYLDYDGLKTLIKLSRAESSEHDEALDRSCEPPSLGAYIRRSLLN